MGKIKSTVEIGMIGRKEGKQASSASFKDHAPKIRKIFGRLQPQKFVLRNIAFSNNMQQKVQWTSVEKAFQQMSGKLSSYEGERIPIVEVGNIYELGKIVALRFVEWISEHPDGVIALPTGKTPEYFIKTLERYRTGWTHPEIVQEREGYGLKNVSTFPDTSKLRFVMLDEFFPMLPTHRNSFCNYVTTFYTDPLGIKSENILNFNLISNGILTEEDMNYFDKVVDLTLLQREPQNELETKQKQILVKVKSFCDSYEQKVRDLGGIGFFLGGIGPDGHIAFNQEGAEHSSTTRLVGFNYPSAAAAAGDLGGIELARGKAAMTIGLATITFNRNATIIIMAAGEGKATVVRDAVELESSSARPSSVLHGMNGARFYITHGAASKLTMRKQEKVQLVDESCLQWALNHLSGNVRTTSPYMIQPPADYLLLESGIYEVSLSTKIPVHKLRFSEINKLQKVIELPKWMLNNELAFQIVCSCASRRLKEKINGGIIESSTVGKHILHTAPHHDDIMLSYHCAMHEMLGRQPVGGFDNFSHFTQQQYQHGGHLSKESKGLLHGRESRSSSRGRNPNRSGSFTAFHSTMFGEKYNENVNHFAYLTSGFHSVNEDFLVSKVEECLSVGKNDELFVEEAVHTGQLTREYDDLMCLFQEAFFNKKPHLQDYIENILFFIKI
jgi:6-phosphogluconolactonase/glucosamine-6-phosphate isomerase/deaminase